MYFNLIFFYYIYLSINNFKGECILRFDDTNPDTESHVAIESIQKNIIQMGYKPHKISFASDYFDLM